MCGIVGGLAFGKFDTKAGEKVRRESSIFITTQLLQKTVERGKDATGVSLLWDDGNYTGLKMGIPSPDFISRYGETEKDYEGILKLWREYPKIMKVFLGHCRKSSVGNSYDNKNNHPIKVDDIMVIHNGTLTNHDIVFDKLNCKRHAEVDTEAISHLLHEYTKNGTEPFTIDILRETCRRLQGTYSVLAASGNNPFQVAQFRDSKPAEMVCSFHISKKRMLILLRFPMIQSHYGI
jgi:glucosamine 6-phosphate synthetase-like amidotransferase/phosphosugar isomerase protein